MNIREKSHAQTRAIRALIAERISAGDWAPGDRLPTERALSAEYGIARMRGRSLTERALDLIAIAHPDFQESLSRDARDMFGARA